MTHEQRTSTSTILLIEADPSLRRLMTLGLQHSGMHVIESCSLEALSLTTTQSLDLIVLDIDRSMTSDWSLLEKIQSRPPLASLPIVVLTWDLSLPNSTTSTLLPPYLTAIQASSQIVLQNKPFDARALHRTIRQLLTSRAAHNAAMEALAEARVLALYSHHTAPSIWPVVTAAGLLLAVIGLMLHVIIAITGILVFVIALLLWTLGTKPEAAPMAIAVGHQ